MRFFTHNLGILLLTIVILLIGWVEQAEPAGLGISELTAGIFTFNTVVRIGILTIVVIGLNILMGYAGQVSLGQAAFYGIGAYVSAIFTVQASTLGIPEFLAESWIWPWLLMVLGIAFTGAFTWLIGAPILRLKGHYLGMATLGLGIMIFILFRENLAVKPSTLIITGGLDGLPDVPRLRVGGFTLWPLHRYYYLVWFCAIGAIVVGRNVVNSRVGRAMRSIHGSEIAAQVMGVDTATIKLQALVMSTMMASLAGSLYAHFQAAVSPKPFDFVASLELVVMAATGGVGTIWGAPLGVTIILGIGEFLRAYLHIWGAGSEIEPIIFGLILILIMIFMPEGIAKRIGNLFKRRKPKAPPPSSGTAQSTSQSASHQAEATV
ncbi:MAG: branched-chain amino acid ABC transporter permease [Chloroflexota bacterium]